MTEVTNEGTGAAPGDESTEMPVYDESAADMSTGEPAESEKKSEPTETPTINERVEVVYPVFGKRLDSTLAPLHVLRINANQLMDSVQYIPQVPMADSTGEKPKLSPWEEATVEGVHHTVTSGQYIEAFVRSESQWRQKHESRGKPLEIMRVGSKNEGNKEVTGDAALATLQAEYGLGALVKIPLWHTGLWITLKAPADTRLNIMMELMALEKITLGRITNGLSFSGVSVWMHETLIKLVLECLRSANLKDYTDEKFLNLLSVHDLPIIYWGLACAVHSNGYSVSQPCLANPDRCKHETKEHLNVAKLSWVDITAMNPEQLLHMENPSTMKTLEEVMKYQSVGIFAKEMSRKFDVKSFGKSKAITFNLKVPSVAQYLNICNKWVSETVEMINNAFSDKVGESKRNQYIVKQSELTTLRQYGHFVKDIVYLNGNYVSNKDDIASVLNTLSADRDLVTGLTTAIREYIDDTVVNVIALPHYKCPACGGNMSKEETKHPMLIPIEVATFFFTLVGRKL